MYIYRTSLTNKHCKFIWLCGRTTLKRV